MFPKPRGEKAQRELSCCISGVWVIARSASGKAGRVERKRTRHCCLFGRHVRGALDKRDQRQQLLLPLSLFGLGPGVQSLLSATERILLSLCTLALFSYTRKQSKSAQDQKPNACCEFARPASLVCKANSKSTRTRKHTYTHRYIHTDTHHTMW